MDEKKLDKELVKGKMKEKVKKEDIRYDKEEKENKKPPMMVNEARTGYYAEPIYPHPDYQNFAESQSTTENEETEYEKFLKIPEGILAEFIDGKIYYLGTPNIKHLDLTGELFLKFKAYLHDKSCKVIAPCEVEIDYDSNPHNTLTLVPDLVVVCDREKITKNRVLGAPDLVVEVLSPSTAKRDKGTKYNKYQSAGVKEYWIIDPEAEEVMVNLLNDGEYEETTYTKGEVIKVFILDNLYIDVTDLFEGYKGAEILEVEVARKEEREKAIEMHKEIAKRLLDTGVSIEQTAKITGLALEVIQQLI